MVIFDSMKKIRQISVIIEPEQATMEEYTAFQEAKAAQRMHDIKLVEDGIVTAEEMQRQNSLFSEEDIENASMTILWP